MIVAIDGPAGSGKSTISKLVAKRLGFEYLDTGAMYRCITLAAMKENIELSDESSLIACAKKNRVDFKSQKDGAQNVYLNDEDVTEAIRTPEVTNNVKYLARIPDVREHLVNLQRQIAGGKDVVLEGRDTTTVVFPNAEYKIYLDADQEERAQRRYIELQEKGMSVTFEEILADQQKRDDSDFNREVGPLKKADDAHVIDTSGLDITQVVDKVIKTVVGVENERKNHFYSFCSFLCRVFLRSKFKISFKGLDNIPEKGGVILACNHASHLDPVAAGAFVKRHISFIARETLFTKNKIFGAILRGLWVVPIKRGTGDRGALVTAEKLLKEGRVILMFPEGTRTTDGEFQDPKSGFGFIACRTKRPVVPVYIEGTFDAMPKGSKKIKSGKLSVTYGKPVKFSVPREGKKNKKELYQKASEDVMKVIAGIKENS